MASESNTFDHAMPFIRMILQALFVWFLYLSFALNFCSPFHTFQFDLSFTIKRRRRPFTLVPANRAHRNASVEFHHLGSAKEASSPPFSIRMPCLKPHACYNFPSCILSMAPALFSLFLSIRSSDLHVDQPSMLRRPFHPLRFHGRPLACRGTGVTSRHMT